ncbi:helix-turn-helix domain-containing protein [Bradyrhizobium viridifuturi]|uniref:helix-turn-helix domain-containing protein n=1 Tax=Bradyrhizobium viridifuturi TaxID=1654716 RepID=UPI0007C7CA1F|nr:AraC family transcriptional regulator [Bradyrhizobium viridifuturi]
MAGPATDCDRTPLQSFQHVRTSHVGALEAAVWRHYPGAKFDINDRDRTLDAVANRCQLGSIALAYARNRARLRIEIPSLEVYALLFAFKGSARGVIGRGSVDIDADRGLIGSPFERAHLDYGAEFEHFLLSVNPRALCAKLEALTGAPLKAPPVFAPAADFQRPDTENLRRLFTFLVDQLDRGNYPLHPLASAEFEQAMIVSFLRANDNNYSVLLRRSLPSAASWQVHRAEAYIEANWQQPLTIEALAAVTGVSARTLFHSFRKSRGYSPMDFVKRVRLNHARRMLQDTRNATSVTDVAFTCGFGNLGHFSGYYRRAFGEPPSATLRHALRA